MPATPALASTQGHRIRLMACSNQPPSHFTGHFLNKRLCPFLLTMGKVRYLKLKLFSVKFSVKIYGSETRIRGPSEQFSSSKSKRDLFWNKFQRLNVSRSLRIAVKKMQIRGLLWLAIYSARHTTGSNRQCSKMYSNIFKRQNLSMKKPPE